MTLPKRPYHPLIYTYLKRYQDDPGSRIFAPLAEAYRKAGLVQEAVEVAREGLRFHPNFVGGRVALARALFDLTLYVQVIQELEPLVLDAPDNLIAQGLLAESYLMLGKIKEALGAYQMLLYYSPRDQEVAKMVNELETQAYKTGLLQLSKELPYEQSLKPEKKPLSLSLRIHQIELLQSLLPKIERYRMLNSPWK